MMLPARPLDLVDVCPCDPMPVMWWLFGDEGWQVMYALDEFRAPEVDRAAYDELGAIGWRIECPECHRVYSVGR